MACPTPARGALHNPASVWAGIRQPFTQAVHKLGDAHLKKHNQALKEHLATLKGKMQALQQHLAGSLGIPLFAIHSPHGLSRDIQGTIQATRQDISGLRQEMKRLAQPAYLKRWIKTARRELASEDYIDDDFF